MKRIGRIGVQMALAASLAFGAAASAQATTVINNSFFPILTQGHSAYAEQLTTWLGKGSLTLTNILDSDEWKDSHQYDLTNHVFNAAAIEAAVSGKGPTFTLVRASNPSTGHSFHIGFYNPLNGVTKFGGNATETGYDAFLFNYTTNRLQRPIFNPNETDDYRVSNTTLATDFYFDPDLPGVAITMPDQYKDSGDFRSITYEPGSSGIGPDTIYYRHVDVYSISVDSLVAAAAVPEPATWATMLVGFGLMGGIVRRSRRKDEKTYA